MDVLPVASELQMLDMYTKARSVISAADDAIIASSTRFTLALRCGDLSWAAAAFHTLVESFDIIEPQIAPYYEEAVVVARNRVARRRRDVATATLLEAITHPDDYRASPELASLCAVLFSGEIRMEFVTKIVTTCNREIFGRMLASNSRLNASLTGPSGGPTYCFCRGCDQVAGMQISEVQQAANELVGDLYGEYDVIQEVWHELSHTP